MQESTPLHGSIYVKILAKTLRDQGYSEQQIFAGSGLKAMDFEAQRPTAPFGKVAAFFENAAKLTGNDILGLENGIKRDFHLSGLISYVGTASPTVLDALKNIACYRRVFSDAIEMNVDSLAKDGRLIWSFRVPTTVERRQHVEFSGIGLLVSMRLCTNREIRPDIVTFRHSRNTNLQAFARSFGCKVLFDQRENCIQFKPSDLELNLVTADNELYSVLTEYCDIVLQSKSRNTSDLLIDVERAIADRLTIGEATQHHVAKTLGMSARTLSRRLAKEGTTFFKTVENLRHSLAQRYLSNSDLVLAEIAYLLGYSGLSSFNDAFKRWTGKTPGQYRGN
ncbi:MAG: AraC family transcriptional regulator [Rhodobacteraceae bacterium]|nr:AraC family transcriptional regulator [Paracoccaceae bacterium]